jgi:hypothetical protein
MDAVPDNCDDNSLCSFHPPCLEKTRFFTGLLAAVKKVGCVIEQEE